MHILRAVSNPFLFGGFESTGSVLQIDNSSRYGFHRNTSFSHLSLNSSCTQPGMSITALLSSSFPPSSCPSYSWPCNWASIPSNTCLVLDVKLTETQSWLHSFSCPDPACSQVKSPLCTGHFWLPSHFRLNASARFAHKAVHSAPFSAYCTILLCLPRPSPALPLTGSQHSCVPRLFNSLGQWYSEHSPLTPTALHQVLSLQCWHLH